MPLFDDEITQLRRGLAADGAGLRLLAPAAADNRLNAVAKVDMIARHHGACRLSRRMPSATCWAYSVFSPSRRSASSAASSSVELAVASRSIAAISSCDMRAARAP